MTSIRAHRGTSPAWPLILLLVAALGGCATGQAPTRPDTPALSPESQAAALFLKGRMLELAGDLLDAAEAYGAAAELDPDAIDLQVRLAHVYAQLGQGEQAMVHAERAFALDPGNEGVRRGLAMLYVSAKRYDDAVGLLAPQFDDDALSQDGRFGLFSLYLEIGRLDQAQAVAGRMIEKDPQDARGHFALGAALQRQNRNQDAERAYRDALEEIPGEARLYDAIARLRQQADDPKGEVAVLEEKLELFPGDVNALRRLAQIEEEAGNREGAVDALRTLARHHPELLNVQFQLGFYYYEDERYAEAIEHFERVIQRSDELGRTRRADEVRYFLGRALVDSGRAEEGLEVLAQLPPGSDRYPDARVVMARIYEEADDPERALVEVKIAAAAVPDNTALRTYQAGLMQRTGDLPGAVAVMQGLIAESPEDPELYYDLGLIYGNADEQDQAIEWMAKTLERDPEHANALNYVGYSWAERGERLDEAEAYVKRAVALRPDDGYITDSLGWVYYQRGLQQLAAGDATGARISLELAVSELERALELLEEPDPIITRHLADAYRSVSRFDDALTTYRLSLDAEPEDDDAQDIRRQIELLESQVQGAAGVAR